MRCDNCAAEIAPNTGWFWEMLDDRTDRGDACNACANRWIADTGAAPGGLYFDPARLASWRAWVATQHTAPSVPIPPALFQRCDSCGGEPNTYWLANTGITAGSCDKCQAQWEAIHPLMRKASLEARFHSWKAWATSQTYKADPARCDCGALTAKVPHARWCSTVGGPPTLPPE